jgi:DNA (cytosine-5)-methyltransferase 1
VTSPGHGAAARRVVDLFAGPGGWEEGMAAIGISAVGIESDRLACETAEAAGQARVVGDVARLDPAGFAPAWGLVASPPCQAYSSAGKGLGKLDKPEVVACAEDLSAGVDSRSERRARCRDSRSILTVEPLRWVFELRPRWIAFEQVPAVAGLWEAFGGLLERHGYRCAVGIVSAECFGVPQVRKRAFLVGSLDGRVALPAPTHRSFHPRRHKPLESERHLPRWRSMAEALGWGHQTARLRTHHTCSGRVPGGVCRSLDFPSYTVISSSSRWRLEAPADSSGRRPATGGRAKTERGGRRRSAPATEESQGGAPSWTHGRPATTLLGDPRITAPGSWPRCGRRSSIVRGRPVRVSPEQAAILQGFRHDYPWRGSRTERFAQIGNAVCPPVAAAVVAAASRPLDVGAPDD